MTNLTVARFEERRKTTNQPWIRHIRKPPGCNFDVPDLEIAQESCTSQMYNDESNEQAFPCFFCYTYTEKRYLLNAKTSQTSICVQEEHFCEIVLWSRLRKGEICTQRKRNIS